MSRPVGETAAVAGRGGGLCRPAARAARPAGRLRPGTADTGPRPGRPADARHAGRRPSSGGTRRASSPPSTRGPPATADRSARCSRNLRRRAAGRLALRPRLDRGLPAPGRRPTRGSPPRYGCATASRATTRAPVHAVQHLHPDRARRPLADRLRRPTARRREERRPPAVGAGRRCDRRPRQAQPGPRRRPAQRPGCGDRARRPTGRCPRSSDAWQRAVVAARRGPRRRSRWSGWRSCWARRASGVPRGSRRSPPARPGGAATRARGPRDRQPRGVRRARRPRAGRSSSPTRPRMSPPVGTPRRPPRCGSRRASPTGSATAAPRRTPATDRPRTHARGRGRGKVRRRVCRPTRTSASAADAGRLAQAYEGGWLACRMIAERVGRGQADRLLPGGGRSATARGGAVEDGRGTTVAGDVGSRGVSTGPLARVRPADGAALPTGLSLRRSPGSGGLVTASCGGERAARLPAAGRAGPSRQPRKRRAGATAVTGPSGRRRRVGGAERPVRRCPRRPARAAPAAGRTAGPASPSRATAGGRRAATRRPAARCARPAAATPSASLADHVREPDGELQHRHRRRAPAPARAGSAMPAGRGASGTRPPARPARPCTAG